MSYLANFSLLVKDYDEAIAFYTNIMDFEVVEDTKRSEEKRWVRIRPKGAGDTGSCLLLAKAKGDQVDAIGNQHAGRVGFFLHVEDFDSIYQKILDNNVTITRPPSVEDFGKVMVFEDLYGNKWDLIQPH